MTPTLSALHSSRNASSWVRPREMPSFFPATYAVPAAPRPMMSSRATRRSRRYNATPALSPSDGRAMRRAFATSTFLYVRASVSALMMLPRDSMLHLFGFGRADGQCHQRKGRVHDLDRAHGERHIVVVAYDDLADLVER